MKKGAALLIVLLFIAIFGGVAVTMTRAGLLNGIFTNNAISAIVSEETSQSGLEVGLLHYRMYGLGQQMNQPMCVEINEIEATSFYDPLFDNKICHGNLSAKNQYVDLTVSKISNSRLISITSVGHYGYVIKKHSLSQEAKIW